MKNRMTCSKCTQMRLLALLHVDNEQTLRKTQKMCSSDLAYIPRSGAASATKNTFETAKCSLPLSYPTVGLEQNVPELLM